MKEINFTPFSKESALGGNPPEPASKKIPDWYKKIPQFMNGDKKLRMPPGFQTANHTIKKCVPFIDAMTSGYIFSLDDDIIVEEVNGEPFIRWRSTAEIVTWHDLEQWQGLEIPFDYYQMIAKFSNHWQIKTPKGYSLFVTHPSNRFDLPFRTFNGFVDTDNYIIPIHFPFILKKGFEGIIKAGTPVAQLIPIKRDSWKSKIKDFDEDEVYSKWRNFTRNIANAYREHFWVKKTYI